MSVKLRIFLVFITFFLQQCNYQKRELYPALKNDKYGYINKKGQVVIEPKFQDAKEFKNGVARVKLNDRWGFINKSGDFVISAKFDAAEDFDSKQAGVLIDWKYYRIDLRGRIVEQDIKYFEGFAKAKFENKWGFIDTSRNFIIEPQFEEGKNFSDGLVAVKVQIKFGYINTQGKIVIKPVFTSADDFLGRIGFRSNQS